MQIDVLINAFIPLAIVLEGVATCTAIIYFKNYKSTWLKLIPLLLLCTFLTDFIGVYIYNHTNNTVIYNFISLISFLYFLFVYYKTFENKRYKIISLIGLFLFLLSFIVESLYYNIFEKSLLYSYVLGGSFLIVIIVLFFLEKLQKKDSLDIKGDLLFWISVGLLLFYVGYLPIKITRIYFAKIDDLFSLLKIVQLLLVMIMNICFTLGFIWAQKKP